MKHHARLSKPRYPKHRSHTCVCAVRGRDALPGLDGFDVLCNGGVGTDAVGVHERDEVRLGEQGRGAGAGLAQGQHAGLEAHARGKVGQELALPALPHQHLRHNGGGGGGGTVSGSATCCCAARIGGMGPASLCTINKGSKTKSEPQRGSVRLLGNAQALQSRQHRGNTLTSR